MNKNKNGQLGLDTAKAFILALLTLAVIAFALMVALSSVNNSGVSQTSSGTLQVGNETGLALNQSSNGTGSVAQAGLPDFIMSVVQIRDNAGTVIPAANYTAGGSGTLVNGTAKNYPSIQVDYTYTYNVYESTAYNITGGVENLFSNATTWFALLAIVIIVLVITVVILAVRRFGGRDSGL